MTVVTHILDIVLVLLVYYVWRCARRSAGLKAIYNELKRSEKLAQDLEASCADRTHLEKRVRERSLELETLVSCRNAEIAEKNRAVELLAKERNLLRTLIDSVPDLIYVKDSEGRYILNNNAHVRFLGAASAAGVAGRTVFEFFPHGLAERYHADDMRVIQTGEPIVNVLEPSADASGDPRSVLRTKVPLRDESGAVIGLVGIARDVTRSEQAEVALRAVNETLEQRVAERSAAAEQRARELADSERALLKQTDILRSVLDSMAEGVVVADATGKATLLNLAAEQLLGVTMAQLIAEGGRISYPLILPDMVTPYPLHDRPVPRALRGEAFDDLEAFLPGHDGNRGTWVSASGRPIKGESEGARGAVVVFHDITEQKQAAAELRESEDALRDSAARLRSVIDTAVDGIITIDEGGIIESVNPAALSIFGYIDGELVGRNINTLMPEPYHAEHDGYLANYRNTGRRKIIGIGREVLGRRKDGSTFPVDLGVGETRLAGRRIFTGIVRDITQRKEAERALVAAKEAAETANRAKSEFLANMSHEIRTPLTAIIGFADIMMEREQCPADRKECLQVIRRNCQHLFGLINDILDLSKIESGQMTTERIACDLPQLLADIASMVRPRATDKGLDFEMRFQGPIPLFVQTDPLRLKQILMNLIGNAIKFTPAGKVTVRTACDAAGPSMALRFDVEDTGIGMRSEQLARLFNPFTQADESTSRRFGGTGLGLAISRRLAALLGGTVTGRSQQGAGSAFTATVDAGASNNVDMRHDLTESGLPLGFGQSESREVRLEGRILYAEDGPDNQRLISAHLVDAGAEVTLAENGQIAVDLAIRQPFDLILMDMQMPELDGYQAAAELRRRGVTIPIVALTAHAMAEDRAKCMANGCSEYLTKPIERARLLEVVRRFLTKSSAPPRFEGANFTAQKQTGIQRPADSAGGEGRIRSSFADSTKMKKVLDAYVAGLPETVTRMMDSLDRKELESLRRAVHQLKGAGGGYGFPQITDLAALAEDSLRESRPWEIVVARVAELVGIIRNIEVYDRGAEAIPGEPGPKEKAI